MIVAVFLVLVASFIAFLCSKLISRPLRRLQHQMEKVATGDFSKGDWEALLRSGKGCCCPAGKFGFISEMANMGLEMYTSRLDTLVVQKTEQLNKAKEAADRANRAKSNFLANMRYSRDPSDSLLSHEIRTPMHGIVNLTTFLLESPLSEQQREWAKDAHSSAVDLMDVLNDILDLSKVEAGKLLFECIEFDFLALVEEQVSLYSGMFPRTKQKDIELLLFFNPLLPTRVIGDPTRLRQILSNLLSNAMKFTQKGSVSIRINPSSASPPEGYTLPGLEGSEESMESRGDFSVSGLEVEVTDTGIGMTPEQKELMFQYYSQADVSTTRIFGGTGLGLFIIKNLVEIFGGTIGVESTKGVGSTFKFSIFLGLSTSANDSLTERCHFSQCSGCSLNCKKIPKVLVALPLKESCEAFLLSIGELASNQSKTCQSVEELKELGRERKWNAIVIDEMILREGREAVEELKVLPTLQMCRFVVLRDSHSSEDVSAFPLQLTKPLKPSLVRHQWKQLLDNTPVHSLRTTQKNEQKEEKDEIEKREEKKEEPLRVLLVEDNLVNQKVAKRIVQNMNCEVSIAENGVEALQKVKDSFDPLSQSIAIDLILSDVLMPEMDGYTAAREIRKWEKEKGIKKGVMIIALTAHAMVEDKDKCLQSGMDGYLSKPLQSSLLRRYLDKCRATLKSPQV